MGRVIKIVGAIIGLIIGIVLIGVIAAVMLFDPNDYRDKISQAASKTLGHTLTIEGPLTAEYFPWVVITAQDVKITSSNDVAPEDLANIGELSLKVKTMPLLKKDVQIDSIMINRAAIHLERNKNGKANWEPKVTNQGQDEPSVVETQASTGQQVGLQESQRDESKPLRYEISKVEINNSQVIYHDKKSDQRFELKDLQLETRSIRENASIPIDGHFELHMANKEDQLDNTTDFSGVLSYGLTGFTLKEVDLKTKMQGKKLPISPLNAALKGNIEGDLFKEQVQFKDIVLDVDQSHATGNATFGWSNNPHVDFVLDIDKIDANRYKNLASNETTTVALNTSEQPTQLISDTQSASNPIVHVAYTPSNELSYKGDITLGELKAQKLTFTKVKVTAQSHKVGLLLKPFSTNLYSGNFSGESLVNFNNSSTSLKGKASNIDVGDLLKTLSGTPHLTGSGNANVDILVDKSGLNGTTALQIYKGVINGVDLDYYLKMARVALKSLPEFIEDKSLKTYQEESAKDRKQTDYNSISATIYANSNVLTNNDLKLNADDFTATGEGTIDLNKQYIQYKFVANRVYRDNQVHEHALPLAVRVKGPFSDIQVVPDMDAYVKAVLEEELKKKAKEKLGKEVDKILGGSGDGSKSPEEAVEDDVKEKIEKQFKKWF